MSEAASERIALTGLSVCASQIWGAVRLVPLVRDRPIEDLRLARECWADTAVVALPDRSTYIAFVPHAFVASWGDAAAAASGAGASRRLSNVRPAHSSARISSPGATAMSASTVRRFTTRLLLAIPALGGRGPMTRLSSTCCGSPLTSPPARR